MPAARQVGTAAPALRRSAGATNFTGTFNGNGNSVSSLNIAPTNPNVTTIGLFGTIGSGGTVENLALNNISITANPNASLSGQSVGSLAGENAGSISGVAAGGSINGRAIVNVQLGGLVRQDDPGAQSQIRRHTSTSPRPRACRLANLSISAVSSAPTLAASPVRHGPARRRIARCLTPAPPAQCRLARLGGGGGFVGINQGIISYAFATGNNTGAAGLPSSGGQAFNNLTTIGGFAGDNQGQIANSAAAGLVGNAGTMRLAAGGFAGSNEGTITSSSATGAVTTGDNSTAGGFVGGNSPSSGMQSCQGCLFGDGFNNSASISNSQASGTVTAGASSVAGGFAATGSQDNGSHGGSFTNVTASGAVNAGHDSVVGGLVGVLLEDGTIANCTAHNSIVASSGPNSIIGGVVGLNEGTISGTASTAPVSGTSDSYIGGITGINLGLVTGSSTDPDIGGSGGNDFIGGIAALNAGSIDGSTAKSRCGRLAELFGGVAGVNAASATTVGYSVFEFPDRHDHQFKRDRQRIHQPDRNDVAGLDSRPSGVARRLHDAACGVLTGGTLQTTSATNNIPANTINVDQQVAQFTQPVNFPGPTTSSPLINWRVSTRTAPETARTEPAIRRTTPPTAPAVAASPAACMAATGHLAGMRLIDMPIMPLPPGSGLPPPGETRFLINEVVLQFGPEVSPQQVTTSRAASACSSCRNKPSPRSTAPSTDSASPADNRWPRSSGRSKAGGFTSPHPNYTYGLSQDPSVSGGHGDPANTLCKSAARRRPPHHRGQKHRRRADRLAGRPETAGFCRPDRRQLRAVAAPTRRPMRTDRHAARLPRTSVCSGFHERQIIAISIRRPLHARGELHQNDSRRGLCDGARRQDHQHELCGTARSGARAGAADRPREGHFDHRRRRQCRCEIAADLSGCRPERHGGHRHDEPTACSMAPTRAPMWRSPPRA